MSNAEFQGDDNGGSLDIGAIGNLGLLLKEAFTKTRRPFEPFGIPNQILRNQQMQATTQARIDADIRLGNEVRPADLARLETLREREARLEERVAKKLIRKRKRFTRLGFPEFLTAAQLIAQAALQPRGQRIIRSFQSPVFNPPPLPTIGGTDVPFTITPSVQASSGGFDFGGFLDTGLRIAERFLAPKAQPVGFDPRDPRFQQTAFAGPLIRGGAALLRKPAVAGVGGGFLGQGLFEGFENLFGGASTEDDAAAFTDPIPGSCRPKAHLKVNPCTGKSVWFTPRGRPLVFSGDLSACKRVARVTKRLTKAIPAKHHHHRTTSHRSKR